MTEKSVGMQKFRGRPRVLVIEGEASDRALLGDIL